MTDDRFFKARTRTSTVGTVVGITLVLFMLGCLGLAILNARTLERIAKENVKVEVFLKREVKEAEAMKLRTAIDIEPFTMRTLFVTADEAAAQLKEELGEDFLGVLGSNPLAANIQVQLAAPYANTDSLKWIAEHLQQDARVDTVAYNPNLVKGMDQALRKAWLILGAASLLLLLVAIALINNTVRLAIYSRRFLIRTMHLVGATQWFIKKPFLGNSLWQGFVAAVLAIGLLVALIHFLTRMVPDLAALITPLALVQVFGGTLALGLLIALISTWFAVRRYLRMNIDDLNRS